jgi:hypothetical protein
LTKDFEFKTTLILDLSIQKNAHENVEELDGVTLIHGLFVTVDR